jgi:hypothetical protein
MRVLLPDNWHFHRRNFSALFEALRHHRVTTFIDRSGWRLWKAHGHYEAHRSLLAKWMPDIAPLSRAEISAFEHRGINLLACIRSEMMCRLLPLWGVDQAFGPNTDDNMLERTWSDPHTRQMLHLCMAAACFWIEHWEDRLKRRGPFSHALVFSGSYIYTRALQEVASRTGVRVFTLEGFFTGHAFYLEERTTPIANNSLVATDSFLERLTLPEDPVARARLRGEALRRLAEMRNKNVRADKAALVPPPFKARGTGAVLIVGQVMNDFSLIETPLSEASSVACYRRIIARLLAETDMTIVFKAHPWERKRHNLRVPVTLTSLAAFIAQFEPAQRARIKLIESEPIDAIFGHVDWVVGLCSQGLLEACRAGFKPMQAGRAFFARRGFTHDFETVDRMVDALVARDRPAQLSLEEYQRFEDFLVQTLVLHLVGNRPRESGKAWRLISGAAGATYPWQEADRQIAMRRQAPIRALLHSILVHPAAWTRLAWSSMPRIPIGTGGHRRR